MVESTLHLCMCRYETKNSRRVGGNTIENEHDIDIGVHRNKEISLVALKNGGKKMLCNCQNRQIE